MPKTILIADDSKFMRKTLKNILWNEGYWAIVEASNGQEAVIKYKKIKPDLTMLDIVMPKKGGLKAAREIINYNSQAKIVIISSMGNQGMVIEALEIGLTSFVIKPFSKKEIVNTLRKNL